MSKKQDDAAKIAGLASILQLGNKRPETVANPSPALPPVAATAAPENAPRTSKPAKIGKYRDPNWHHYGVYLRKDTHKRATRHLEDLESKQDLSELLQMLLEQWLADT